MIQLHRHRASRYLLALRSCCAFGREIKVM